VRTEPPIIDYASPRRTRPIDPARVVGIVGFSFAIFIAVAYVSLGVFAIIRRLLTTE
jgi:hypothetical protein